MSSWISSWRVLLLDEDFDEDPPSESPNTSATGTVSSSSRCVFFFLDDAPVLARLEIISSFFSSRFPFEDDVDPAVADFDSDSEPADLADLADFDSRA